MRQNPSSSYWKICILKAYEDIPGLSIHLSTKNERRKTEYARKVTGEEDISKYMINETMYALLEFTSWKLLFCCMLIMDIANTFSCIILHFIANISIYKIIFALSLLFPYANLIISFHIISDGKSINPGTYFCIFNNNIFITRLDLCLTSVHVCILPVRNCLLKEILKRTKMCVFLSYLKEYSFQCSDECLWYIATVLIYSPTFLFKHHSLPFVVVCPLCHH